MKIRNDRPAHPGLKVAALLLAIALLLCAIPFTIAAETVSTISGSGVTQLILADAYAAIGHIDGGKGQLYLETTLGAPYFDGVRTGDKVDMKVNIEKAGTYQWCVVNGWANGVAGGIFRLFIDGEQVTEPLQNTVPGSGWRTWLDSTHGTVELPAGEHTLSLVTDTAGPNIYALKLAPEGVDMTDVGGTVSLCNADSNTAVQVSKNYAVQFAMTVPFDSLTVDAPSYSNNKGSFRFELFKWNETYKRTVSGTALASEDYIDFNDNATLSMRFSESMTGGEYLLLITNISEDPSEQVGLWTSPASPDNIRCYSVGIETPNAPRMSVHYTGITDTPLGSISANLTEDAPVYEEITESMKDLSQYGLPSTSRYLTAEIMSDTWVFTDGLGRVSLTNADVGDPREDRTLAMFYWIWHATFADIRTPFNVQEFIDSQTEAGIPLEDYLYDFNYSGWPSATGAQYFWDEPIWGYYRSDDTWVLRKQAELLSAAGVDVVFSDNSNATLVWADAYPALYETWYAAQQDGLDTPKISYLMPFAAGSDTQYQLNYYYTNIYHDGKYRSLWYYLDGKPMLMAYADSLSDSVIDSQIKEFFTYRPGQASYFLRREQGTWGWLSVYPQALHYHPDNRKVIEQISVGVAQNANYINKELAAMSGGPIMGRSYTSDKSHLGEANSSLWGYNFAEQFEYALEKDPKVIFVTGWNEWVASRYASWPDSGSSAVTNAFPDTFNDEYSRDLEPSRGALGDNYYYQFVNFARRYKGARAIPTPSVKTTIDMSVVGNEDQWQTVEPYYAASIGNTGDRDSDGYLGTHYSDYSGRNDIIGAQVARDDDYLYFHVECAEDITPYTDDLWMNLYIDINGENDGWNSFNYVVNKSAATVDTVVLEKFTGEGYESVKVADCAYTLDGRYLIVKIAKSDLGLSGYDFTVNFAWTDNVHDVADTGVAVGDSVVYTTFSGDILDFYTSGDVAPGGRFKYSYISTAENAGNAPVETETETETETVPETETETETETVPETETDTETVAGTVTETTAETDTAAVSATETETDATTTAADEDGCRSVTLPIGALILSAIAGGVLLRRKKEGQ